MIKHIQECPITYSESIVKFNKYRKYIHKILYIPRSENKWV